MCCSKFELPNLSFLSTFVSEVAEPANSASSVAVDSASNIVVEPANSTSSIVVDNEAICVILP